MSLDLLLMNSEEFGHRLRSRRIALGLNQDEVAGATRGRLSRGGLSQWESGKPQKVDAEALLAVATKLQTSVEYLLFGLEPTPIPSVALANVWHGLTPEQQAQIVADAVSRAEENQRVLDALGARR
jgi:transcriptional regulator with XRE-family HTH domain